MIGRTRHDCTNEDWSCGMCSLVMLGLVAVTFCLGDNPAHPVVGNSTLPPQIPCGTAVPFYTCNGEEEAYVPVQDATHHFAHPLPQFATLHISRPGCYLTLTWRMVYGLRDWRPFAFCLLFASLTNIEM